LKKVEKLGTWNKIEANHNNRQVGNGAKRPKPQATQPNAWRDGNKLRSKARQKQTLLVEERPHVSGKSQVEGNISSSTCVNGAPTTNRPMPLRPPPSLTTQAKPILRPQVPSVEAITAIKPKASPTNDNEVVSTGTHVERCWSKPKDCIISLNKCKPCHNNYSYHGCAYQSFYKSSPA
jgi:hypothetical protein